MHVTIIITSENPISKSLAPTMTGSGEESKRVLTFEYLIRPSTTILADTLSHRIMTKFSKKPLNHQRPIYLTIHQWRTFLTRPKDDQADQGE